MHEKQFDGSIERLRSPERVARLGLVLHESDEPLKALQEARRVARKRVCILEWSYLQSEFGPPLAHRLKSTDIDDMAQQAGFTRLENIQLTHLAFYRLTI